MVRLLGSERLLQICQGERPAGASAWPGKGGGLPRNVEEEVEVVG